MRALLDLGADPTIRDAIHGGMADGWAEFGGHDDIAALLREARGGPCRGRRRPVPWRHTLAHPFSRARVYPELPRPHRMSSAPARIRRSGRCARADSINARQPGEPRAPRPRAHDRYPRDAGAGLGGARGIRGVRGWNPFMRRVAGAPAGRKPLRIELTPPDGRRIVVSPSVVVADPARELRWRGALPLGLFTGEHAYLITPAEAGTRVVHRGWYRGLLVRIFGRVIDRTGHGFEHMHRRAQGAGRGALPPGDRGAPDARADGAWHPGVRGARLHASHPGRARRRGGARGRAGRRARPRPRRRDARPPCRGRLAAGGCRTRAGDGRRRDARRLRARERRAPGHPRRRDRPTPSHTGLRRDGGDHRGDGSPHSGRRQAARCARCLDAVGARVRLGGGRVRRGGGGRPRPGARRRSQRGPRSAAVGALLAAAEADRVRVATELHDDTLQTLTAMRLTSIGWPPRGSGETRPRPTAPSRAPGGW